jgi:hypothetical protein
MGGTLGRTLNWTQGTKIPSKEGLLKHQVFYTFETGND